MLYLALSCLQGRSVTEAVEELSQLAPGRIGIQLTPGCVPSYGVSIHDCRTHHGYTPYALRQRVWNRDGTLAWQGDSVHPPMAKDVDPGWRPPEGFDTVLETMYPGYAFMNDGATIELAMDMGLRLAVDTSHVDIQRRLGLMSDVTLKRLMGYDNVHEVHLSRSVGHKDSHHPAESGWGADWAREKLQGGTPVVIECFMHKLTRDERLGQVELMLGGV